MKKMINIGGIEFEVAPEVEVFAVKFGPKQAEAAIRNMTSNQRTLSNAKKLEYAKEMAAGKWKVSNDAAVVCGDEWLNSNHRLNAIVESQTEQVMLVLKTDDSSIMRIIDGGKPRQISDVLFMETGTTYSKDITSIGLLSMAYMRNTITASHSRTGIDVVTNDTKLDGLPVKRLITRQEKVAFIMKHRLLLLKCAEFTSILYRKYGPSCNRSIAGALMFLAIDASKNKAKTESIVTEFLNQMFSGESASPAVKKLRTIFLKDAISRRKIPTPTKFGLLIKTYNTHIVNGQPLGHLSLKESEKFPEINPVM
ncbi:MAG: hypothetical protein KGL39_02885 [Patescibacteria group bacterium]|nr:hypothetical protein [Patescibacteria group bacterium]